MRMVPQRMFSGLRPIQVGGFSADYAETWMRRVPQSALSGLGSVQVGGFSAVFAGTWMRRAPPRMFSGLRPIQVGGFSAVFAGTWMERGPRRARRELERRRGGRVGSWRGDEEGAEGAVAEATWTEGRENGRKSSLPSKKNQRICRHCHILAERIGFFAPYKKEDHSKSDKDRWTDGQIDRR